MFQCSTKKKCPHCCSFDSPTLLATSHRSFHMNIHLIVFFMDSQNVNKQCFAWIWRIIDSVWFWLITSSAFFNLVSERILPSIWKALHLCSICVGNIASYSLHNTWSTGPFWVNSLCAIMANFLNPFFTPPNPPHLTIRSQFVWFIGTITIFSPGSSSRSSTLSFWHAHFCRTHLLSSICRHPLLTMMYIWAVDVIGWCASPPTWGILFHVLVRVAVSATDPFEPSANPIHAQS
jgi:hypothetical protein